MKVLMVIPARQGSRRLPDKNILLLGGKPLFLWTIEAAERAAELLRYDETQIIVSTDSSKYAEIAGDFYYEIRSKRLGAKAYPSKEAALKHICPFLRPPEISDDCDSALPVKHAWEYARDEMDFEADLAVTLQPTSPFRTAEDILRGVNLAKKSNADCVFSAKRVTEFPEWMWTQSPGCFAKPYMKPEESLSGLIAQDIPIRYVANGATYVTKKGTLLEGRIYGQRGRDTLFEMPEERSIDIEEQQDLDYSRFLLQEGIVK